MRRGFGRAALAAVLAWGVAAAVVAGCEDEPGDPAVGFLDGQGARDSGGSPADTSDAVVPSDAPPREIGPPDAAVDAGPPCFASPYVDLAIAAGAFSSYSRAEAYPSVRQWTDRARALGYRGVIFQDKERRGANTNPFDQFSDTTDNETHSYALQHVYIFDKNFEPYTWDGDGASARPITREGGEDNDPEILTDPGVRLKGVEGGWAQASKTRDISFSYDLQDLSLQVRVKAPRTTANARILVRYTYAVRNNKNTLTWVLYGPALEGESVAPFTMRPQMTTVHLPLKQQILEQLGPQIWPEGALTGLELRVEGDAEAVFDEVRLRVDAYWADYRAETTKYNLANGLLLIPGVEYYFIDNPNDRQQYGQIDCVSPDEFPASTATPADGLLEVFGGYGCFTIADRPWAGGAAMKPEYIRMTDAVEVWHPLYEGLPTINGAIALDQWDEILLDVGPRTAIGSSFARDVKDLSSRTIHNRVLTTIATEEEVVAALRAGRSYMTDDVAVRAALWAERPDCRRGELGEQVPDALALHATVTCPAGVRSAKLVQIRLLDGLRTEVPLPDAGSEAVVPVADWPACYVRLEAECNPEGDEVAPRVYTNPIWLTDTLP
jgi:hypothetical protein